MYGRVCVCVCVCVSVSEYMWFRSVMSALILPTGKSWWSPLDVSCGPLATRRPGGPHLSGASGCMDVEAAPPAAPLAFIALRNPYCPDRSPPQEGEGSWSGAVDVLFFVCFLPFKNPHITTTTTIVTCFFCFLCPPVCSRQYSELTEKYRGGGGGSCLHWRPCWKPKETVAMTQRLI